MTIDLFSASPIQPTTLVADNGKVDWKSPNAPWRLEPIKGSQFKPIAIGLRTKNLHAITDPAWLAMFANGLATYDETNKKWPMVAALTRGQAADLIDLLSKLPKKVTATNTATLAGAVTTSSVPTPVAPVSDGIVTMPNGARMTLNAKTGRWVMAK